MKSKMKIASGITDKSVSSTIYNAKYFTKLATLHLYCIFSRNNK